MNLKKFTLQLSWSVFISEDISVEIMSKTLYQKLVTERLVKNRIPRSYSQKDVEIIWIQFKSFFDKEWFRESVRSQ